MKNSIIVLCAIWMLSLAGCSGGNEGPSSNSDQNKTPVNHGGEKTSYPQRGEVFRKITTYHDTNYLDYFLELQVDLPAGKNLILPPVIDYGQLDNTGIIHVHFEVSDDNTQPIPHTVDKEVNIPNSNATLRQHDPTDPIQDRIHMNDELADIWLEVRIGNDTATSKYKLRGAKPKTKGRGQNK